MELQYQWLVLRHALADDVLLETLRVRLNAIPGVSIAPDRMRGRPTAPLSVLDEASARSAFLDACDAFLAALPPMG